MSRKIIAITGTRSEYDLQYSVAKSLNNNPNVDFGFIVFGAHLCKSFGETVNLIHKDNFKILTKIFTQFDSDEHIAKAKSTALLMQGICSFLENQTPDLIMVAGDREETIIAATIATFLNIPVAHLYGGDNTFPEGIGDIDEQIRHATTKLSHIHFPIHPEHAQRIEKMGEEPWRIHCLGSPALDKYTQYESIPFAVITDHFQQDIKPHQYAVVIHHPLPNNIEESLIELENIFTTLKKLQIKAFISYPNSDPGNQAIIDLIEEYAKDDLFIIYKNISRDIFIPLIKHSSFLIGNSSMGLLECPFLETPAINVGKRQQGRLNAGNVIFCNGSTNAIEQSINNVLYDSNFKDNLKKIKNAYGDGFSGEKIAYILATLPIDTKLLAKRITY